MHKFYSVLIFLLCVSTMVLGQGSKNTALVKGVLRNKTAHSAASDIQVSILRLRQITNSDDEGNFEFSEVPKGPYMLVITGYNIKNDTLRISVDKDVVDLGEVNIELNNTGTSEQSIEIPTIALEDNNKSTTDDGVNTQGVGGLLAAANDPFQQTAAYVLGQYYFQPRGNSRTGQEYQVNGVSINNIETNYASWGQLGSLYDVFHSRTNTYGLGPSDYTFGNYNGSVYFDATAADQRKETKVTYTNSDRNYRDRVMFTTSSGLMKSGWAYSFSGSRQWANEGYVQGTFYDGYSFYGAVSKVTKKNQLNFTAFGSPTKRGKSSAETKEADSLAGSNYYNSYWGYQNGKVRNSRVANTFQPIFILNDDYKISDKSKWSNSFGYQFGKNKNSSLDWYNAADPRPDYYAYMPSYYLLFPSNYNPAQAAAVRQYIGANPSVMQLNWANMYSENESNNATINNVNGIAGNTVSGKQSLYVLSNDVTDLKKFTFNTRYQQNVNEHITYEAGINFISEQQEYYRQLDDLLGGQFYVNYNQFAARQYVGNPQYFQQNLNQPNEIIKVGDKYDYDYTMHYDKGTAWTQGVFKYNIADFFVAANAGYNSFYRQGFMRNGLFPMDSYGNSDVQSMLVYGAKAGVTFKLDGKNFLFLNGEIRTDAPTIENTYISPQTRDWTVTNPTTQLTKSMEAGYLMHSSRLNIRAVGYVTDITGQQMIQRFYDEQLGYNTFVNYVMQNVNTRSIGTELAVNYQLIPGKLDVTGFAAIGQAFYTNRPNVSVYADNDTVASATSKNVYIKNYYLPVGPQSTYSVGLKYQGKKNWYVNLNFNYLDRNYTEIAVDRRSAAAANQVVIGSPAYHQIFDQEELPSAFTADLHAGKSFRLSKISKGLPSGTTLFLSLGINNLFNNLNVINSGYEQLRYDFTNGTPGEFPSKYIYGYGINYFFNASLRF